MVVTAAPTSHPCQEGVTDAQTLGYKEREEIMMQCCHCWRARTDSNRQPPTVLWVCFQKHLLPVSPARRRAIFVTICVYVICLCHLLLQLGKSRCVKLHTVYFRGDPHGDWMRYAPRKCRFLCCLYCSSQLAPEVGRNYVHLSALPSCKLRSIPAVNAALSHDYGQGLGFPDTLPGRR